MITRAQILLSLAVRLTTMSLDLSELYHSGAYMWSTHLSIQVMKRPIKSLLSRTQRDIAVSSHKTNTGKYID